MPAIITATAASLAMVAGLTAYLLSPEPSQQRSTLRRSGRTTTVNS
ncbi:MAG: hypothetical protein IPF79_05660 [Ignavibacteria bacterium]|nr:hypothetical protein [Ignavibacteria bacterium]